MNMYTYHVYANVSLSGPTLHNRLDRSLNLTDVVKLCMM